MIIKRHKAEDKLYSKTIGSYKDEMKYFIVLLLAVSALAMPDREVNKEALFDDELIGEETVNAGLDDSDIQATDTPIEVASSSLTTCLNAAINSAIDAKLADQPG